MRGICTTTVTLQLNSGGQTKQTPHAESLFISHPCSGIRSTQQRLICSLFLDSVRRSGDAQGTAVVKRRQSISSSPSPPPPLLPPPPPFPSIYLSTMYILAPCWCVTEGRLPTLAPYLRSRIPDRSACRRDNPAFWQRQRQRADTTVSCTVHDLVGMPLAILFNCLRRRPSGARG